MKITDIKAYSFKFRFTPSWPSLDRQGRPLDYYPEYISSSVSARGLRAPDADGFVKVMMIEIETDEGVSGIHMPLSQALTVELILQVLRPFLIGMNPLANRTIYDKISRFENRARGGTFNSAISSIDNALWDLKGKAAGMPVYALLGGGRTRLQPYVSTLGCDTNNPDHVAEYARKVRDMNVWGQKWFFRYGPSSGIEGMKKNIALVQTVRDAAGPDARIMFDVSCAWDMNYCVKMLPYLEEANLTWLEEPFRPDRFEMFKRLSEKTNIPIATGEKLFNRFEVHELLKTGGVDILQPEPESFGGVTEAMRTGELCEMYGAQYSPHGSGFMPLVSVTAAMSPDISPTFEFLWRSGTSAIAMLKDPPVIEADGFITMDERPGLYHPDYDRIVEKTEIKL